MWGSNIPLTRTPDAHWMTEARYRGQKVVVMSPDYAEATKFADEWVPVAPGTDAALGMAMGHVVLKEFFVDRRVPFFEDYNRTYNDSPFLVTLDEHAPGLYRPGKNLVAGDVGGELAEQSNAMFKPPRLGREHRSGRQPERYPWAPVRGCRHGQVESHSG